MARFQNKATGVVVNAGSEPTWGGEWERLGAHPAPQGPAPSPRKAAERPRKAGPSRKPAKPKDQAPAAPERPHNGASLGEWEKYAKAIGLNVDGLRRDEIRTAVAKAAKE